jgi:hypothetical protein
MPRGVPYRAGLSLLEEIAALMKREDPALNSS